MSTAPPIIIKRAKAGHTAHHGGAWKVAYADFVTAMMALFIVLWLMNTNEEVQKAIGGYFRDPQGYSKQNGSGAAGSGDNLTLQATDMVRLKEKIEGALSQLPEFQTTLKGHVSMTVTGEGLRIELLETETGVFFDSGNAHPTPSAEKLLAIMSAELGKLPNRVVIEGHTDSRPFSGPGVYTNWELAADRANSARRLMQSSGVRSDQITQVRGFADQKLKLPEKPADPSNRRVSVVVQNAPPPASKASIAPAGHGAAQATQPHGQGAATTHKEGGH
jgi:chemotaxis protein MotB